MPETSRSFHYWQPAPRWQLSPWLSNPGNPAMSPQGRKRNRHPSHCGTVERGRGRGERRTAWAISCHPKAVVKRQKCLLYAMLQSTSTWNSSTCAYVSTPMTTRDASALCCYFCKICIHTLWSIKPEVIPVSVVLSDKEYFLQYSPLDGMLVSSLMQGYPSIKGAMSLFMYFGKIS